MDTLAGIAANLPEAKRSERWASSSPAFMEICARYSEQDVRGYMRRATFRLAAGLMRAAADLASHPGAALHIARSANV
jgi:hypothetical protein